MKCFWFSSGPVGDLVSSAGLPGAFPSFAPYFLVRSLPSTLSSEIVLHFSFLGVPFPFLIFRSFLSSSCLASFLLEVGVCPAVGCWLVCSVCICFIQSGVALLLLLLPLVLLSFVSFFVGLLVSLRLRWFLLHYVFLGDSSLLLFWFLCSGSAGLSYRSFPHPSFWLTSFVLFPLFSLSGSAAAFYAFWSSFVALCLAIAFLSSGFHLGFLQFPFLIVSSFPGFFIV